MRIAGLSPDTTEELADLTRKSKLSFPLLSDAEGKTLSAWGLRNPEIDAKPIPHPTAIVVDAEGVVRYLRIDRDFRERPAPAELLSALDATDKE